MAEEILNKLGFDVTQALTALQNLDTRLQASQMAFQSHATQLTAWNSQAQIVLATMRQMANVAARVAMPTVSTAAAVATAAPATPSKLWLPPGLNSQINQASQSMNKLNAVSNRAGQQMVNAGNRSASAINNATKSTERFSISWQMLTRIVMTQAIVRALSAIRNMLREVVTNSIDFQRSLAEIQAITPKIHGDFASLGDEAVSLSKKFNIPLPQVTEALYQSISNQFVTISDRTRIMEASMRLARVGCMDLDDAVLLLTGTLNAYGIGAENADAVSGKFFKTIQMGRIRGKELADTLGTVIPFAAQLGVSLEEISAAYVSMTIGGLEARKTATGLRQVIVQLLKPSEDLKLVFRGVGVANAEQLVQAKGLIGSLQAISDAANNMGSEVVKSVRNVRALTAQLSLTRNNSEEVIKAFEEMGKIGGDSLQILYDEFTKMPAEELTKEVNALSVTLTQDLGAAMTQLLADMFSFFGGADKVAAALETLVVVLGMAGTAVLSFAITLGILHLAAGPVGWALLAIGAGLATLIGASTYQSIRAIQDIKAVAEAHNQAAFQRVKDTEEALRKIAETENKAIRESIKRWEEKAMTIRKDFFRAMDELRLKNTKLIENTRTALTTMLSAQSRVVSAYKNAARAASDAVQQSRERQMDAESAYSDAVYKYARRNEGVYARAEAYMRRSRQLANEAEAAMRRAKTPEQIAAAQAAFQRADAAASEAEQIANSVDSVKLQGDAQRQVLSVMLRKVGAEKALQRLQAAEAKQLAAKAASEQARLDRMKVLMKTILADLQAFDKAGAREPKQLIEQENRLQANIDAFRQEWLGGQKIEVADLMAFDKLQRRVNLALEGGLTKVRLKDFYATADTFSKLRVDIEKGIGPVRILLDMATRFDPELEKSMEGLTAEGGFALLSEEMGRSADALDTYRTKVANKLVVARKGLEEFSNLAAKSLGKWFTEFSPREAQFLGDKLLQLNFPEKFKERADALTGFTEAALKFTRPDLKLDEKAFQNLSEAYSRYLETVKPSAESLATLNIFISRARLLASQASSAQAVLSIQDEASKKADQAEQRIKNAKAALDAALRAAEETKRTAEGAGVAADAARGKVSAVSQINMTSLTTQTQGAATAMWDLAYASASVKAPMTTAAEFSAFGGRAGRYLATGGPVGTDTIPAWLSQGEFVMNAGASRKFASQLVAMNAGVQPTFRSEGGSVTTIGDINVSVKGGDTSRQTVRDIATELRRELRRGTTTF